MELETSSKILEWIIKITVLVGAAAGLLLLYVNDKKATKETKSKALSGTVEVNEQKPNLEDFRKSTFFTDSIEPKENNKILSEKIRILMGDFQVTLPRKSFEEGQEIQKLISFNGNIPIIVKVKENKILITTKVFGQDGKVVAEIIDNEWRVNPNNYLKRNFDDHGFEVVDQYDITLLQVDYRNSQTIYIAGVFYSRGSIMILSQNGMLFNKIPESTEKLREMTSIIKPIFKYDGKDYLGKRNLSL